MLLSLRIENFAIISSTQVDFSSGFNVLTGETGAGKSILMEALGLILGNRSHKSMIRDGSEKAEIEAVFTCQSPKVIKILEENGFDFEEVLIIQKTIYLDRPSISRLNGKSISNGILSKITSILADSTHQQENHRLLSSSNQIQILDRFLGQKQKVLLEELSKVVAQIKEYSVFFDSQNLDEQARLQEMDLLNFQLEEIKDSYLIEGEDVELESEHKRARASSKISQSFQSMLATIEGETGLKSLMESFSYFLNTISDFDKNYQDLSNRVDGLKYEWLDIFSEVRLLKDTINFDESRLVEIENRLDTINRLKRKYGNSISEIKEKQIEMQERLFFLENFEKELELKQSQMQDLKKKGNEISALLSKNRKAMAQILEDRMVNELRDLNIPKAKFYIEFKESDLSKTGIDKISYLISTNAGEEMKALSQVASGGEMSRILLALKSIMAEFDETETLIFDEIDTGMGGKTAKIVGEKMYDLSKSTQLIVISHLPQVVAQADTQFQIQKEEEGQRTRSTLKKLSYQERIDYLATMISGTEKEIAVETAKSMLDENLRRDYEF